MKMSAFERVIGYESIKNELMQICDMIHNKEVYEGIGAKQPHGVLLYGKPGLGKSLMAKCLVEECGIETFTVRRNRASDDFVGHITETFQNAKEHAPSIVFLDDMDKFANEDAGHRDAEDYVAVQSGIDEVKNHDILVIATVNDIHKLPKSLIRSGRFDRKIEVERPSQKDAYGIVRHYLADKKVSEQVNMDDLIRMISYSSCAELETILNEAAVSAAFRRKSCIEMEDLVQAVLRIQYDAPENYANVPENERKRIAMHEAGHLVVCEVLDPGSVGFATLRGVGEYSIAGRVHCCRDLKRMQFYVMVGLAGKAAVELYHADDCADGGCQEDIKRSALLIREGIVQNDTRGFGLVDVHEVPREISEELHARREAVIQAELERFLIKTKGILLENRAFLEKTASALQEKETLLYSDICAIKKQVAVNRQVLCL